MSLSVCHSSDSHWIKGLFRRLRRRPLQLLMVLGWGLEERAEQFLGSSPQSLSTRHSFKSRPQSARWREVSEPSCCGPACVGGAAVMLQQAVLGGRSG